MATVQAQFDYPSMAPPAEFFDSYYSETYYSDYNATDSDYGYSTYDYGQTGSLLLAQSFRGVFAWK